MNPSSHGLALNVKAFYWSLNQIVIIYRRCHPSEPVGIKVFFSLRESHGEAGIWTMFGEFFIDYFHKLVAV